MPYGYRVRETRELVPVPEEQAALWLMLRARAAGWTLQRIADLLGELGVRTRAGTGWSKMSVRAALLRETGSSSPDLAETG